MSSTVDAKKLQADESTNKKTDNTYYFFLCIYPWSRIFSIVQAWSTTKHMIISVVHTPPMLPPCMDYGNYPMFGNL